jgi:hypothetical protein
MVAGEVPNRPHAQCRRRFEETRLSSVVEDLRKHGHFSSRGRLSRCILLEGNLFIAQPYQ